MVSRQRGFTILELTMTIALLGALSAMAIPAFNGYLDRAKVNRAIGEIGRVSVELYRWRTNNNGAFPATLAAANITLGVDPWGNAYTYLDATGAAPAALRKDASNRPVNSDFDLYSKGPDGATALVFSASDAADDVVRANNGAYIGPAADY